MEILISILVGVGIFVLSLIGIWVLLGIVSLIVGIYTYKKVAKELTEDSHKGLI